MKTSNVKKRLLAIILSMITVGSMAIMPNVVYAGKKDKPTGGGTSGGGTSGGDLVKPNKKPKPDTTPESKPDVKPDTNPNSKPEVKSAGSSSTTTDSRTFAGSEKSILKQIENSKAGEKLELLGMSNSCTVSTPILTAAQEKNVSIEIDCSSYKWILTPKGNNKKVTSASKDTDKDRATLSAELAAISIKDIKGLDLTTAIKVPDADNNVLVYSVGPVVKQDDKVKVKNADGIVEAKGKNKNAKPAADTAAPKTEAKPAGDTKSAVAKTSVSTKGGYTGYIDTIEKYFDFTLTVNTPGYVKEGTDVNIYNISNESRPLKGTATTKNWSITVKSSIVPAEYGVAKNTK